MRYQYDQDDDNDLSKERKQKLKGVQRAANLIQGAIDSQASPSNFGLCSTCSNFQGVTTKYERVFARCNDWLGVPLNKSDPVTSCTFYDKRGSLELSDLKEMATLIDPDKKIIGFGRDEER